VQTRIARSDWTAFGTDADVTHGNSGGPVLDGNGDVLGVVSFGIDASGNTPAQNYFVPSGVVKRLLDKSHVKARPGTATSAYYRALQDGDLQHYKRELPRLQALADRMPANTYVKDDVTAVQSMTLGGQDRTPPDLTPYWPIAAGASGGALALVLLVMVVMRLTSRRQPVNVPAAVETGLLTGPPPQVQLSPDGRWWWDGQRWQPVDTRT
jgi:hypothetical protein